MNKSDNITFGTPHKDAEKRNSIIAFVEGLDEKVLTIYWGKKLGGKLLVGGGLKEGEDPIACASREITEETGYIDFEFIERLPQSITNNYFAASKNVWRTINICALRFNLKSNNKVATSLEEDEKDKFTVEWNSKEDLVKDITDPAHLYVLKVFIRSN